MQLVKKPENKVPLLNLTKHFYCNINQKKNIYITPPLTHTFHLSSDVDGPTTATISIYAQNTGSNIFSSRNSKQELCLGSETIELSLHAKSKTTERFVLKNDYFNTQNSNNNNKSGDIQLLVVHGTYISRRTQNMLNNTILFEDFITAYIRTGMVPVSKKLFIYIL